MIVSLADVMYARSRYRWRQLLKISSTATGVYEYSQYEALRTKSPSKHVRLQGVVSDYWSFYHKRKHFGGMRSKIDLSLRGYE